MRLTKLIDKRTKRTDQKNVQKDDLKVRPGTMTFSKQKLSNKLERMTLLILLAIGFFTAVMPALAIPNPDLNGDRNNNAASDIEGAFHLVNLNNKNFHDARKVVDQKSQGPGTVNMGESGMPQVWPQIVAPYSCQVPALEHQAIMKNLMPTHGYPASDTFIQACGRMDDNIMVENFFDPEKAHWMATATAGSAANAAANSAGSLAINQALSAIDFCKQFLTNFTAEPNNVWQKIRDQLFVPMAILLLLPGAVLAQVKAIVSQGSPVLVGEIHPFEGLLRSIVAIFLIPGTFLVINYGIDVANSLTYTIANEYQHIFGSDMYEDAKCAMIRAFPMNKPEWNRNSFTHKEKPRFEGTGNWARLEGFTLATARIDPCAGIEESRVPDEDVVQSKNINRLMMNTLDSGATISWNLACAFQMAFLYYLWCMGPVAAALWVWPVQALRGALSSWIDGVITVCFWSLFWNTTILLMACFRGVGDSGTIIMTALIFLAVNSVKSAFDFAGLASAAVADAAGKAQSVASAAGKGGGGQNAGGSHGGQSGSHGGKQGSSVGSSGPGHGSTGGDHGGKTAGALGAGQPKDAGAIGSTNSGTTSPAGGKGVGESGLAADVGKGVGSGQPKSDAKADANGSLGDQSPPPNALPKGGKGSGDGTSPPPGTGDVGDALGGAIGANSTMSGTIGGAFTLNTNSSLSGGGGGGGAFTFGQGGTGGGLGGGTDKNESPLLGGLNAGIPSAGLTASMNATDGIKPFDLNNPAGNKLDLDLTPDLSKPVDLNLANPANALPLGTLGGPADGAKVTMADVPGANGAASDGNMYRHNADGQLALNADGKPMLDTSRVGDVPPLAGNLANDPGAISAQKTATDVMAMSNVTSDQLSRAMADPTGADYRSISDATHVAPPVLDAALHGNTSAGVMTAVGFGGTDTAASFSAPAIGNDTASMAMAANHQAQAIAGGDSTLLARATTGMDSQAAAQLLASPQMDAQFANTMSNYSQAREATGSYAQTDGQYASMSNYGGVAQSIAPNMISGDLSPAGAVATSNGFQAPYSVASNDAGAISAQHGAADIMQMTHTSPAELQRALSNPSGAEYQQLSERFGASPALMDAALHGNASAAAVVETGFGHTAYAQENAATSFTAHQSVEMYNSAASTYGASTVQSAAVDMNVSAGQQILQNNQLDQQFSSTVGSYRDSALSSNNYTAADQSYMSNYSSTPAVTSSLVTGGADAPGALAASVGYSVPTSVGADAGAISAQRSAADIMVMSGTQPAELQRALSNPSGPEYTQLSERLGASPVLMDAALHGSSSAAAIVETGFGHTQTAHQYADSGYSTAQQSVQMHDTAAARYGEQTVQAAASGDIGSAQQILQSSAADQQFANTIQSYQQAYASTADSPGGSNFSNVDYGYVSSAGAQPAVTPALVGGDPSPVGGYANAAGYSAPYALPTGDAGALSAQRSASDIMAMTHTSPQELRAALAHPESQQYQQLAERLGASPALVDSALHGNVSAAVVASAGFGGTQTAQEYASQSQTAAMAMQYNASAQSAAQAGGYTGGDVVRQAAIEMNPSAGQAMLGGTGLDNQYNQTVAAYQTERSNSGVYSEAPAISNQFTSSGGSAAMANDMVTYNQPQYSGYQAPEQVYQQPTDYTATTDVSSAATWAPEVQPDVSTSYDTGYVAESRPAPEQYQQQQPQQTVYNDSQPQPRSRLADALGGAAIAKVGGQQQKPAGGAPVAKSEGPVDKGAPPVKGEAVNRSMDPQAGKRSGKTKAQLEKEAADLLREQMKNMPGNDGMA